MQCRLAGPSGTAWLRAGQKALVVVLLGAPAAAHLAILLGTGMQLAGGLLMLQAACVTWIMLSICKVTSFPLRISAVTVVWVGMGALWARSAIGLIQVSAVPHAISYAGLLAFFVLSLSPGHEPVITIAARRLRGALTPPILRYTRQVTIAWCVFFLAQLAGSLGLALLAAFSAVSPWLWSQFVNVWNMPLVLAMFLGEFVFRRWYMAAHAPSRFIDAVRAARHVTPGASKHDL